MADSALAFDSIAQLAAKIRDGKLSPVALTQSLLDRIAALDGHLHAFIAVTRERALAEARAAELAIRGGQDLGPLHGIPYAAKDLIDVRGVPTTAGTRLLAGNVAKDDATVIRRLAGAGMILVGKTYTVQFAERRTIPGTRRLTRRVARRAVPRWRSRPGWSRWPSGATPAARCACPRRCAAPSASRRPSAA
jgi:Asp-tRNA(Asn)/Glu-tRNA(Gln) amidotransferase A subunit family amidase